MNDFIESLESNYPKYQYSKFDSENGQYVVRTEVKEEFEELIRDVKKYCEVKPVVAPISPPAYIPPPAPTRNVSADEFDNSHVCPEHGTQMVEKASKTKVDDEGNPIKYWSHSKQENGKWLMCFGKGFKSK